MAQKWNLQDIRPAGRRPRGSVIARAERINEPVRPTMAPAHADPVDRIPVSDGRHRKTWNWVIAGIVFVVIVSSGFVVSAFMSGAEVTVYPRNREPNVNAVFTAYSTPRPEELTYELLQLEATGERQVTATGEQEVAEPATGTIEIVKTTAGAQRLIKNTRFASPDGLIFKITDSVIVPGAVTAADGTSVPGSIMADVFAEANGQEYNLEPTRFTVPGLASDKALFESIYAENKQPFTGGFKGPRFTINEGELQTATQALHIELRDSLLGQVSEKQPAGFIAFPDAIALTYESLPAVEYGNDLVTIKEKAILQIPIFKADELAAYLGRATIPGYDGAPVRIDDPAKLTFAYAVATTSNTDLRTYTELPFKLAGKPLIVWTYDSGKLATELLQTSKTALPTVLSGFPAIERAEAVIRPFWKRSFPESLENMKITEVIAGSETN